MRTTLRLHSGLLAGLLFASGGYGQGTAEPPAVFVDRGACPGECCVYGSWRAERSVDLYEAPAEGARQVGQIEAGAVVRALTGQVRTIAGRFVVRKETPPYRPGDVIWVYTDLGEGYYRVWNAGEMVTQEISVAPDHQNPDDWGYYDPAPVSHWWIRVRQEDGREGWTNAPESFSGTDSCS